MQDVFLFFMYPNIIIFHQISGIFPPTQKIFLADKGPPPLTIMSAKNVYILDCSPKLEGKGALNDNKKQLKCRDPPPPRNPSCAQIQFISVL